MPSPRTQVILKPELDLSINKLAKKLGYTKSGICAELIKRAIETESILKKLGK